MNKKSLYPTIFYGSLSSEFKSYKEGAIEEYEKELQNKDKEIERLNNIINILDDLMVIKLQRDYHEPNYRINTGDLEEIYDKLR